MTNAKADAAADSGSQAQQRQRAEAGGDAVPRSPMAARAVDIGKAGPRPVLTTAGVQAMDRMRPCLRHLARIHQERGLRANTPVTKVKNIQAVFFFFFRRDRHIVGVGVHGERGVECQSHDRLARARQQACAPHNPRDEQDHKQEPAQLAAFDLGCGRYSVRVPPSFPWISLASSPSCVDDGVARPLTPQLNFDGGGGGGTPPPRARGLARGALRAAEIARLRC